MVEQMNSKYVPNFLLFEISAQDTQETSLQTLQLKQQEKA